MQANFDENYKAVIGYLQYSGEGASDKLSIPIRIRERHLKPETDEAILQAIGTELQIFIQSIRDTIIMRIPFNEWMTTDAYKRKIGGGNGGQISIGKFEDAIVPREDGDRLIVEARIFTIDKL